MNGSRLNLARESFVAVSSWKSDRVNFYTQRNERCEISNLVPAVEGLPLGVGEVELVALVLLLAHLLAADSSYRSADRYS